MDNYGCKDIDGWLSKPGRFPNVLKPKKGGCNHDFKNSLVGPYSFSRHASSFGGAERRGTGYSTRATGAAWSPAASDRRPVPGVRPQRIHRALFDPRDSELHYNPGVRGVGPTWLHCPVRQVPIHPVG